MDLLLSQGTIISDGVEFCADLAIHDGAISAIGDLSAVQAEQEIDCAGRVILPGAIDLGLNLLDDGPFDPESGAGFSLATREAIRGGVTTIINTMELDGDDHLEKSLQAQIEADSRKSWVDFSYHLLIDHWNVTRQEQIRQALQLGVPSAWLARTPLSHPQAAPSLFLAVTEDLPEDFLLVVSPFEAPLAAHSLRRLMERAPFPNRQWKDAFPENFEVSAIQTLAHLSSIGRSRILFNSISTAGGIAAFQAARERHPHLAGACCLHHLYFTEADGDGAPRLWPPCRTKHDQHTLFAALEDGLVGIVTSGHKPRTEAEASSPVRPADDDCRGCPPVGGATLARFLPLLHGEGVLKWRLSLGTVSLCAAADPAKLAGLYPRKGTLQPGSDADVVILDPQESNDPAPLPESTGFVEPFGDHRFPGRIERVLLRGREILSPEGLVEQPTGQFLARRLSLK